MASSSEQNLTSSTSRTCIDSANYFYKLELKGTQLKTPQSSLRGRGVKTSQQETKQHYCIPLNLVPEETRLSILKGGLTALDHQLAQFKTTLARLQLLSKKYPDTTFYIIEPPKKPEDCWQIKTLYKKTKVIDVTRRFFDTYNNSFEDTVFPKAEKQAQTIVMRGRDGVPNKPLSIKRQKLPVSGRIDLGPRGEFPIQVEEMKSLMIMVGRFENAIASIIQEYGDLISPKESVRSLWDSLSQSAILHFEMEEEARVDLSKILLVHWQDVHWHLGYFLEKMQMANATTSKTNESSSNPYFEEAKEHLKQTLEELSSLSSKLPSNIDRKLADQLIQIGSPLLEILEGSIIFQSSIKVSYIFLGKFHEINDSPLDKRSHFSIKMQAKPETLRQWLQFRITLLQRYLETCDQENPNIQMTQEACSRIAFYITHRQWILAYQAILTLKGCLDAIVIQKNVPIIKDGVQYRVSCLLPNQVEFKFIRYKHFLHGVLRDFQFLISEGKLLSVVSLEAKNELFNSYNLLNKPLSQLPPDPLADWLQAIGSVGGESFKRDLQSFSASWQNLRQVKKALRTNPLLPKLIAQLKHNIETESYENLYQVYAVIALLLPPLITDWEKALRQISVMVESIYLTSLAFFYSPSAPPIAAKTLHQGFSLYNQRLLEIAKPITEFINAFRQLIEIGAKATADAPGSSTDAPRLLFTEEGEELVLRLFPDGEDYFEDIQKFPKETASLEHASSSLSTIETTHLDIVNRLKEIFQETKSDKIQAEVEKFLNALQIPYTMSSGTGSHKKLYLSSIGIPIILPGHREWKPGTKKSIENSLLEQLQEVLKESQKIEE